MMIKDDREGIQKLKNTRERTFQLLGFLVLVVLKWHL